MNNIDLIQSDFRSLVVLAVLAWALLIGVLLRLNAKMDAARSIERPTVQPCTLDTDPEETDR